MWKDRFQHLSLSLTNTGLRASLTYAVARLRRYLRIPARGLIRLHPPGLLHPMELRRGASSDLDVYRLIFIEREYDPLQLDSEPALIVDLGANIGASAAFFLSRYPGCRVIAVEPEPENFQRCRANLAPYGDRAIAIQAGVWSHSCALQILTGAAGDGREWATQVRPAPQPGPHTINALDVPSILDNAGCSSTPIDLLKVDIEGSEVDVFGPSAAAWLPQVRNICIELHGPACDAAFYAAIEPFRYRRFHSGELTICQDLHPLASAEEHRALRLPPARDVRTPGPAPKTGTSGAA